MRRGNKFYPLNRKEIQKCSSKHKESESPIFIGGPKGPTGPTGATGGTGPTGPTGSIGTSFISYYSGQVQSIPSTTSVLLAFTSQKTTDNTITVSASGSAPLGTVDTFTVTVYGNFLITWNVSIDIISGGNVRVDLLINGTAINSPFQTQAYNSDGGGNITVPASGSFLTNVNLDQTIQIQVTSNTGDVTVSSPSISIIKVAEIYFGPI